jgi:hypothetical protein
MSTVERTIDHTVGDDGNLLANLSEDQEDAVEIQKVQEMTVEPGLMKLPVKKVVTAENSDQYAIIVDHPVEGEHSLFVEKPVTGWSREYTLVRMFDWYGITGTNPHQLQLCRIYVEHNPEEADRSHGWRIVQPPNYETPPDPMGEQVREMVDTIADELSMARPNRTYSILFGFTLLGVIVASMMSVPTIGIVGALAWNVVVNVIVVTFAILLGMVVTDA